MGKLSDNVARSGFTGFENYQDLISLSLCFFHSCLSLNFVSFTGTIIINTRILCTILTLIRK